MHVYKARMRIIIPWGLFFFVALFYINNLCPTISWRDAPEFVTVSHNLDISHPAGSPTYSLSSKLLTLIPIGNIALRVNLFSAISSSLCMALIFILSYQILDSLDFLERIIASALGSLSIICSQAFNNFSLIAEVYTFQNFFLLLLLILIIKSCSSTSHSHLKLQYCFAFLYGISLGVHASMAIFIPAFILYCFISNQKVLILKNISLILFFSILGFFVYIYLPFRSLSTLSFDWGNPETLTQFLAQIFDRKDYNKDSFYLINPSIFDIKLYLNHLLSEFSIVLCLIGMAGFFKLLVTKFRIAVLLFLICLINILLFLNAGWTVSWGYIPSFVIFSVLIGIGISVLNDIEVLLKSSKNNYRFSKKTIYICRSIIILITLFWTRNNLSLDIKNDFSTKLYGNKVLSELPSDSIIFSEYLWFPLLYLQQIEHKRPDITVVLQGEVLFPKYFEAATSRRFPNIKHIDSSNNNNATPYEYFWNLAKINAAEQHLFWEPDGQFQKLIADYITPYGLLFSFNPYKKREITKDEIEQMSVYLENLQIHSMENIEEKYYLANKINYLANFWSKLQNEDQVLGLYNAAIKIWPQGETINTNYGTYLMSKNSLLKASQYLKKSYEISSNNLTTNKNLANFLFRIKDYHASLFFLENILKKTKSRDEDIESLLGAVHYELKKYEKAKVILESALEILEDKYKKNKNYMQDEIKTKWIRLYKELCFERLTM